MKQCETQDTIYDKTIKRFLAEFGCNKIQKQSGWFHSGFVGCKIINNCSFNIEISYGDYGAIYIVVTCSKSVRNDQIVEALKIINSSNIYEMQAKYTIGVIKNDLSCTTIHVVGDEEKSIHSTLDNHVECSIENLESIYDMLDDESSNYL